MSKPRRSRTAASLSLLSRLTLVAALACSSTAPRAEPPQSRGPRSAERQPRGGVEAANRNPRADCPSETPIWKRDVDAGDGIDRCEAHTLVDAFNRAHPLGCGAYGPPQDAGAHWSVPVWVGATGTPLEPLRIQKSSGKVTAPDPTCDSPPCARVEESAERLLEARSRSAPERTEPVRFRDGVAGPGNQPGKDVR